MRSVVFVCSVSLLLFITSCFPVQRLAREFAEIKRNKVVVLLPPEESDILLSYYPLDPYEYDISESFYSLAESRFLEHINDSIVIDLYMEGLTDRLNQYNIRYIIPDSKELVLQQHEKAYFFTVAQLEMLEYLDTVVIESDSVYIKFPDHRYAYVYSASELEGIEYIDTVKVDFELEDISYQRQFSRTNIEANTWLEFVELDEKNRPVQVLFSMQYTSDMHNGYFMIEYPDPEIKFSHQSYFIYLNDVLDLIYFSGYKNGEYIADHIFNLFLEENLGKENVQHYYKYDPFRNRATRANDDRFIIMDP